MIIPTLRECIFFFIGLGSGIILSSYVKSFLKKFSILFKKNNPNDEE
jgi:hypothetical protein